MALVGRGGPGKAGFLVLFLLSFFGLHCLSCGISAGRWTQAQCLVTQRISAPDSRPGWASSSMSGQVGSPGASSAGRGAGPHRKATLPPQGPGDGAC